MTIGLAGAGMLNIENGGTVSVDNDVILGYINWGSGEANLSGGTLDLNGSDLRNGDGTAIFYFTGGTLAPGGSIGQTNVVGDYDLTAGTIEIELGGIGNPIDFVTVTGNIDIALTDTTLNLLPIGFMAAGTYTVLESTGGTLTGEFEFVTGIGLYAGLVDVTYSTNAVMITLNWDFLPGDLNADGFVGLADVDIVLAHWNQSVPVADLESGDYSRDGFVGLDDLDAVLGNWNQGTPPTVESLVLIPEPGVLGLMLVGGLAGRGARRWRA